MRIGVVGAGNIAGCCLEALSEVQEIRCAAICVRESSLEQAKRLQEKFAINTIYTDFVYLGIPNNLHFAYARASLEAGKHVICEKSFTSNYQELLELSNLAREKYYSVIFDNRKLKRLAPDFSCDITLKEGVRLYLEYMDQHPQLKAKDPGFDLWCEQIVEHGVTV